MSYLLFPGRHLINTRFQAEYLKEILKNGYENHSSFLSGKKRFQGKIEKIIFAVTSSNQSHSRYNPIPFFQRTIGVDRFARTLGFNGFRILGIPHYGHTTSFAEFTLREIRDQTEGEITLTPENCIVLCSTPEVVKLYQELGFSILTAELGLEKVPTPIDLIRKIGVCGAEWKEDREIVQEVAPSAVDWLADYPEIAERIARIYRDPLTTQDGGLTQGRNYSTYARGMNEIVRLKYLDIRENIRPGRIVDEGCADGALLTEICRDFPDSDFYGIDLSAEFAHRFQERQRAGEFSGTYVHFFLRNLLEPIFEPESMDTTICNSTLHELWSYGGGAETVRGYLRNKFLQLTEGGRLIIRDVVAPMNADQKLWLKFLGASEQTTSLEETSSDRSATSLNRLSDRQRFDLFAADFLKNNPQRKSEVCQWKIQGDKIETTLRFAAEYLSKKDYTDNWLSEMNEEFCFWDLDQWRKELNEIGFTLLESSSAHKATRIYCNEWIVKNRWEGKITLQDPDSGKSIDYPPTNMVIVAEKPQAK